MDESDSDSSVERMFLKYSKKFTVDAVSNSKSSTPAHGTAPSTSKSEPGALNNNYMKSRKFLRSPKKSKKLLLSASSSTSVLTIPGTSGCVAIQSNKSELGVQKPNTSRNTKTKRKRRKRLRDSELTNDTEYVPPRNYAKMSSRQLNNIAGRVRVYHETGVIVSDDENIIPCKNKNKKTDNEPKKKLAPLGLDHFGNGQIGMAHSPYGVQRCLCCNLRKQDCMLNRQTNTAIANIDIAASLGVINPELSKALRKLSTGGIDRFKKREARLLEQQQRDLLKHPELLDLFEENSDEEQPPPPPVLSAGKLQLIQKFMDSMTPDRIDYVKPKTKNIVDGIVHSPAHRDSNEYRRKILTEGRDENLKTIVARVDFKKENERRSGQTTLDHWLKRVDPAAASTSTPKFNSTELDNTVAQALDAANVDVASLSPIKKEAPLTAVPFNISGIECIDSENDTIIQPSDQIEVPLAVEPFNISGVECIVGEHHDQIQPIEQVAVSKTDSAPEVEVNLNDCENNDQIRPTEQVAASEADRVTPAPASELDVISSDVDANSAPASEHNYADFSHLDRSNITLRGPLSGRRFDPSKLIQDRQRSQIDSTNKGNPEASLMIFVDDLLVGEEEDIHKEAEERHERLLESARQSRNVRSNDYVYVDDYFDNEPFDNSVQIIDEFILPGPSNSSSVVLIDEDDGAVEIVDGPTTGRPTLRRACRNKRKPVPQKTSKRVKAKKTATKSEVAGPSTELEEEHKSVVATGTEVPTDPTEKIQNPSENPSRILRVCPVCLEPLHSKDKELSSTICGHVFCTACIVAAVRAQKACPNCRTKLTLKKIHPLFF